MLNIKNFNKKVLYEDYEVTTAKRIEHVDKRYLKKGEKIPIVDDKMFKTMLYNSKRIKYSAKLLSYFIDIDYEYLLNNMKLSKNEIDKEVKDSKGESCDYVAELKNTYLSIEMNCNTSVIYLERNLDYGFKWYSKKNVVGRGYNYRQLIMLNINNFSFKGLDETYYINTIGNKEYCLTKKVIFIDIYLPNIVKKCYTKGIENLEEWERYLMTMSEKDIDTAKVYAKGDTLMNEYIKEAEKASFELHIGESYDHEEAEKEQCYEDGKADGIEQGLSEGIKQGIEEGKKQSTIRTAIAMLKKNFKINDIAECTGLSIQELKNLQLDN